ncbi:GNAT family N-acetyltransferase [Jiulongibacter sediminis]|uniref:Acetyltransferase n=1 Tax=Jiulongibacter sediminis TaxID=1605367 RepID=A0A0P7BDC9_9BACT|nr:GNAT family N-acetyltransferase [Jiulongibacter sediminis]KPM48704.1 acetyltransferase [Jiulongibacter sediminis]TBX25239.1 acetyltransferase [Jiulongibacter sediminis]
MILSFKSFIGEEIKEVLEPLAELRIQVFRDYPYLYDGSIDYEREYLKTYTNAPQSFLFAVFNTDQMVGATTCIPLKDETAEVREPFLKASTDLNTICYFGESILLKEYRGQGLGNRFFEEREAHARNLGAQFSVFCAIKRPETHPLRPADYQDLKPFWKKRGYSKSETLQSLFSWKDIDEPEESPKLMEYWTKTL